MCVSVVLGVCDFWIAGTAHRHTLFSKAVWASGGGTRGYVGFGYSLTYYRGMGDANGPEIWYWFTPFTVYRTTEHTSVRWLIPFGSGPREPIYQGRNLSQWISIWYSGYSGSSPHATQDEAEASERAIRAMGTNCIPCLVAWLSDDRPDINQRSTVLEIFQILGEQARPAAPALIQLTKSRDKEIRWYAFDCLRAIKPEKEVFVPVLAQLIHDPDKNISYYAAESLVQLDSNAAEKAGVFARFPQLK